MKFEILVSVYYWNYVKMWNEDARTSLYSKCHTNVTEYACE